MSSLLLVLLLAGPIDVRYPEYNVPSDGISDAYLALQAIIDASPQAGTVIYLAANPAGGYHVTQTLDCHGKSVSIVGDTRGRPTDGMKFGSVLWGDLPGPLYRCLYPSSGVIVENVGFLNRDPAGGGLQVSGSGTGISHVSVWAFIGIEMAENAFSTTITDAIVHWGGNTPGSVGVLSGGHTYARGLDISGFDRGIVASGVTFDLEGARIEVNRTGIAIGQRYDGTNLALSRSSFTGLHFEANDTAIVVSTAQQITLTNFGVSGSLASPNHQSIDGVWVRFCNQCTMSNAIINGTYSGLPLRVQDLPLWTLSRVRLGNTYAGGATTNIQEIP